MESWEILRAESKGELIFAPQGVRMLFHSILTQIKAGAFLGITYIEWSYGLSIEYKRNSIYNFR